VSNNSKPSGPTGRPAGYAALIRRYDLRVIPNWHESVVGSSGSRQTHQDGLRIRELFPASYWPGDGLGDQLEFALKYDGINLSILALLFQKINLQELTDYIRSKPTGWNARRIWYLYEFLTRKRLELDDLIQGNYVDLLDVKSYYTAKPRRVRRQRINDNLLQGPDFCPVVRRTARLEEFVKSDLRAKCLDLVESYPEDVLNRALSYLYTKETRSSYEIEHVPTDTSRTERFVTLLRQAEKDDFLGRESLVALQNQIVDERFRDRDYRKSQNYVGEAVQWQRERVHFVSPKPEDLASLMEGLLAIHERMVESDVDPVIHAAIVAFGFVFIHPFEDGNGRIHRFLIHNILSRRGFTPKGVMFPVSAAMLNGRAAYDAALEAFSRPLLRLVDYTLDDVGQMTVHGETAEYYRYIDLTTQAEALFDFIARTIETDLVNELEFLRSYDGAKKAIPEIVDLPDRLLDLFIRFCLQNKGELSAGKRARFFASLTDAEIQKMERALQEAFHLTTPDALG